MSSKHLVQREVQLFGDFLNRSIHHVPSTKCFCLSGSNHLQTRTSKPQPFRRLQTKSQEKHSICRDVQEQKITGNKHEHQAINRVAVVLEDTLRLLHNPVALGENVILESLTKCEDLAKYFKKAAGASKEEGNIEVTPAENLLFLDESDGGSESTTKNTIVLANAIREQVVDRLSNTAYTIVTSPNVFITPRILDLYVNIQTLLGRPETLSEALKLYAGKPIPKPNTSPVQYSPANTNKITAAVPLKTAITALQAAIQAKNLALCFDIIKSTVCTPAYHKSKFIRRALVPLSGLALAPPAAYTLASQLSVFQDTMSTEMATNIAFAGILSYVVFTATIGVVAITTANDQMDRVTWATGTPLRERWLREEERAMIDQVAISWGFRNRERRGEEEGVEWDAIREFAGLRGMVLDRVSLMEGME